MSAPPLSETKIPMSWLSPAFAVQRSALAVSRTGWFGVAVQVTCNLAASMSCHVAPSLFARWYWFVEDARLLAGVAPAAGQEGATPATTFATLFPWNSVNQTFPSGPAATAEG